MRSIRTVFIAVLVISAVALAGCSLTGIKGAPTPDPLVIQATLNAAATQALQTLVVQFTQTAEAMPTENNQPFPTATQGQVEQPTATLQPTVAPTLAPTATLVPTLIPTATRIPATSTPAYTATPAPYACQIVSQSPVIGARLGYRTDFDGVWKIKNVGTKNWEVGAVDFRYDSGTKMQKYVDRLDIPTTVKPGEEITFTIDMLAPDTEGNYKAVWKLVEGGTTICTLNLDINVFK